MMREMSKNEWMSMIATNIEQSGQHITIVQAGTCPRFAYTIGLYATRSIELVFAGGIELMADDVMMVMNQVSESVRNEPNEALEAMRLSVSDLGQFRLVKMHTSWTESMVLGVFDFYQTKTVECYQVVPDQAYSALDVPDMSKAYDAVAFPIWKYLKQDWDLNVPEDSVVITDLQALKGQSITELMRWEKNEWEMFSGPGPEIPKEQIRIVPIATMLGIDRTLFVALDLNIGKGLWRSSGEDSWQDWG